MAGLYIHIPFCKQKCHYCNFYSLATKKYRPEVLQAMEQEMLLRSNFLAGEPLQTIYFGGGTPSLIPIAEINRIIQKAGDIFGLQAGAEITIEANPDDVNDQWLAQLAGTPVNRLSIGVQSFDKNDLLYLNRIHTAQQAQASIYKARKYGFENLSIDLIYGIPTLDDEHWRRQILKTISLEINHISAYALTVEPGTALDHFIKKGTYSPVDDKKAASQFNILMEEMERAGYHHYEISNFSMPEKYARHNTAYWNGSKYLGIGPSAHAYDGEKRYWNIAHLKKYMEGIANKTPLFEFETLTPDQHYNEYVMTALRTMWGIDAQHIKKRLGLRYYHHLMEEIQQPLQQGLVIARENKRFLLSKQGKFFADRIAAGLFV